MDKVLEAVFFLKDSEPNEKSTLLFIDEIQNSTKAVSMLRYLYEDAEDLFVVCAGSLLISYTDDAAKYASGRSMYQVIRHIIETSPMEAGKRIKFQGFGNSDAATKSKGFK